MRSSSASFRLFFFPLNRPMPLKRIYACENVENIWSIMSFEFTFIFNMLLGSRFWPRFNLKICIVWLYRKLSHIPLVSAIPLGMGFHQSQLHPSSLVYSPRLRQNLCPSGGVYKSLVILRNLWKSNNFKRPKTERNCKIKLSCLISFFLLLLFQLRAFPPPSCWSSCVSVKPRKTELKQYLLNLDIILMTFQHKMSF